MSLTVSDLSFSYGEREVLHNLSFSIPDGTLSCVLGPNGVGKTTLFRCVLGLMPSYTGSILVNGHDIKALSVRQRAREMSYIPQAHANIFDYEVVDMVLMSCGTDLGMLRSPKREHEDRAMAALESVGIPELAHRRMTRLSGGQQQLVLVARAVAQGSKTIVMDEPTSALDFANTARVLALARKLADQGHSVLMSTHQPEQAYCYSDEVVALQGGKVAAAGAPGEVVTEKLMSQLYGIDVRISSLFDDRVRVCTPATALGDMPGPKARHS
ncbi:MAG: ABC transporter ATP-binding protein [Tractidigestivibacter sp.]|jgi:iron complex transport system ATP-binding protein|uniref:ABC transporter ATP-binding protein n=1 Tax=Tractidigestivibacter sp. TaxID=2847320 RepID=UPI003D8BE97D